MQTELLKLIENFDVISFDVFDTLLLRPYLQPTDLFAKIGGETFRQERIQAERKARELAAAEGRSEISFDAIYNLLPRWPDMKARELEEERRCLVANPEMLELWKRAGELGKKRVIASDMYLGREVIEELLRKNGVEGWDALYLSSDRGVRKATGKLYELMLKELAVNPLRVLHIGDNQWDDISGSEKCGMASFLYEKIKDRFLEANPFVNSFLAADTSLNARNFVGAMALGWHLHGCTHPDCNYWDRLGLLIGGSIGYGYVKWMAARAKAAGIKRLLMVARDGYVLRKIASAIAPELSTDYVYISRKSTLFASNYYGSTPQIQRKRRKFCLDELERMQPLDLSDGERESFVESGAAPKVLQDALKDAAERVLQEMRSYFSGLGVDPSVAAMVDGCSRYFTIQRFVRETLGVDLRTFYLQTEAPVPNGETFWECDLIRCRYVYFAEFIFGAPTPPVDEIRAGQPVFKDALSLPWGERFKMSVNERMSEAAVSGACALELAQAEVSTLMLSRWINAFSDNLTAMDKSCLSLARASVETGHEGNGCPIVQPVDDGVKFIKIFGRPLLSVRWQFETADFRRKRAVLLFDRIVLFKVWKWWWSRAPVS